MGKAAEDESARSEELFALCRDEIGRRVILIENLSLDGQTITTSAEFAGNPDVPNALMTEVEQAFFAANRLGVNMGKN